MQLAIHISDLFPTYCTGSHHSAVSPTTGP